MAYILFCDEAKNALVVQLTVKVPWFLFYLTEYRRTCDLQAVALPFVMSGLETTGAGDHEIAKPFVEMKIFMYSLMRGVTLMRGSL